MDEQPSVQPEPESGPQPEQQAAPQVPLYSYFMTVTPGRVRGAVSTFREGILTMSTDGVLIDGKTLIPTTTQMLVIIGAVITCVGWLVAVILIEYVLRVKARLQVGWDAVEEIVLEPRKSRICLVYQVADKPGKPMKPKSLAFRLPPDIWGNFAAAARYLAPGKVREGKIAGQTTTATWVLLGIFVALIAFAIVGSVVWGK